MKILDGEGVSASDIAAGRVAVNTKSRVMVGLIDDQSCQQTYLIDRQRPILDNALNDSFSHRFVWRSTSMPDGRLRKQTGSLAATSCCESARSVDAAMISLIRLA
jgi:hypothetical protein